MKDTLFFWILRMLGNLCFRLNGGLDGIDNKSWFDQLTVYFWAKAYPYGEPK